MNAAGGTVPSTVAERLAQNLAEEREIWSTPCARCGHGYGYHGGNGLCARVVEFKNDHAKYCSCRQFVDPVSCLEGME